MVFLRLKLCPTSLLYFGISVFGHHSGGQTARLWGRLTQTRLWQYTVETFFLRSWIVMTEMQKLGPCLVTDCKITLLAFDTGISRQQALNDFYKPCVTFSPSEPDSLRVLRSWARRWEIDSFRSFCCQVTEQNYADVSLLYTRLGQPWAGMRPEAACVCCR